MVFFLLGGSLAPQWRVAQEIEVAAVIRLQDLLLMERGVAAAKFAWTSRRQMLFK
jgi:hypothetical protein